MTKPKFIFESFKNIWIAHKESMAFFDLFSQTRIMFTNKNIEYIPLRERQTNCVNCGSNSISTGKCEYCGTLYGNGSPTGILKFDYSDNSIGFPVPKIKTDFYKTLKL